MKLYIRKICLTGGIACGKSAAGAILAELGFAITEADHVCHELMSCGTEVYKNIVSAFGREILNSDGQIDRGILGRMVFEDPGKRSLLNNIVHPAARKKIDMVFSGITPDRKKQQPAAIIPLVYEVGWEKDWDVVVCIATPRDQQVKRLAARGLPEEQIFRRIAAQMPVDQKMTRADYVVFNSGSKDLMKKQLIKIFT